MIDENFRVDVHARDYAIIAFNSQVPFSESCDNRFCAPLANNAKERMDIEWLKERMEVHGMRQVDLAEALCISQDKIAKVFAGKRQWQSDETLKLLSLFGSHSNMNRHPDLPPAGHETSYVDIPVMPSFAGMGGGGTGEGEQTVAKLPRDLIETQLRGRAQDFELIDVRGDSMEPDFHHGDQILVDRRDCDPRQPGAFALWDGDGYVVKLIERVPTRRGWLRVFSANARYTAYEIEETEAAIRGRPVWFARRI
jgi:phage repressor protein C with HTH and peptisase S24 domain